MNGEMRREKRENGMKEGKEGRGMNDGGKDGGKRSDHCECR